MGRTMSSQMAAKRRRIANNMKKWNAKTIVGRCTEAPDREDNDGTREEDRDGTLLQRNNNKRIKLSW